MLRLVQREAEEDLDRDVFDQVRQRRRWRHGAGGGGCEGLAVWVGLDHWGIAAAQPVAAEERAATLACATLLGSTRTGLTIEQRIFNLLPSLPMTPL
jgi:hypothetical protein